MNCRKELPVTSNSGRRGFVEISEITKAPAWRRVLDWSREELMHRFGQPAGLERVIKTSVLEVELRDGCADKLILFHHAANRSDLSHVQK